jgi:hypothetical protein
MNSRTALALGALLACLHSSAQQPGPVQKTNSMQEPASVRQPALAQPPASAQPWEMENWLNSGDAQEKSGHIVSLGVGKDVAEGAVANEVSLQWKSARSGTREKYAILFVSCFLDDAHLYLLVARGDSWTVVGQIPFDCHYDMSVSVEITSIRNPAKDEILMHHVGEGHGAGYSQQDFEVYGIVCGKLKPELDAEEVVVAVEYLGRSVDPRQVTQRSTFVLVPIAKSGPRIVEETRSNLVDRELTVQRRQFWWNASKGRYIPTKFSSVEAVPNQVTKPVK